MPSIIFGVKLAKKYNATVETLFLLKTLFQIIAIRNQSYKNKLNLCGMGLDRLREPITGPGTLSLPSGFLMADLLRAPLFEYATTQNVSIHPSRSSYIWCFVACCSLFYFFAHSSMTDLWPPLLNAPIWWNTRWYLGSSKNTWFINTREHNLQYYLHNRRIVVLIHNSILVL